MFKHKNDYLFATHCHRRYWSHRFMTTLYGRVSLFFWLPELVMSVEVEIFSKNGKFTRLWLILEILRKYLAHYFISLFSYSFFFQNLKSGRMI